MGNFWRRIVEIIKGRKEPAPPSPRRSPWVLVEYVAADVRIQCGFCGREAEASPGHSGDHRFALVRARYNPKLQHIVCESCLERNRITSA
jgi:hypothetical protein